MVHTRGMNISDTGSWVDSPRFGFDTETTGVDPTQVRLVTAAIVTRDSAGTDEVSTWLADPGVPIPEAATAVHGISTERAQRDGRPIAEVLEEVASRIAQLWSQGAVMIAYNVGYDLQVLMHELERHGLPSLQERCVGGFGAVADPLVLDRALDRYRKGKRTLEVTCDAYCIRPQENLHTAECDVITTLDVLQAIVEKYPELRDFTARELLAYQREQHAQWAQSFNAYMERQGRPGRASQRWPY